MLRVPLTVRLGRVQGLNCESTRRLSCSVPHSAFPIPNSEKATATKTTTKTRTNDEQQTTKDDNRHNNILGCYYYDSRFHSSQPFTTSAGRAVADVVELFQSVNERFLHVTTHSQDLYLSHITSRNLPFWVLNGYNGLRVTEVS